MKYQLNLVLCLALTVIAASVSADDKGDGGKGAPSGRTFELTWDQFKQQCADPKHSSIDAQVIPENIVVQCTDESKQFVPAAVSSFSMPAGRQVTTSISSNKFVVRAETASASIPQGQGSCGQYQEMYQTFTQEYALNCEQILSIKGDIQDYCASQTQLSKGTNPKLVTSQGTGNTIDTCTGQTIQGGGKGPVK